MITCLPIGMISWDYRLILEDTTEAILKFSSISQQAEIRHPQQILKIAKNGVFNANWVLTGDDLPLGTAYKPNPFVSRYKISANELAFELVLGGIFSRRFDILVENKIVGNLAPINIFTRQTSIDCSSVIPVHLQLFSLVLAVFVWRQSSQAAIQP